LTGDVNVTVFSNYVEKYLNYSKPSAKTGFEETQHLNQAESQEVSNDRSPPICGKANQSQLKRILGGEKSAPRKLKTTT